MAAYCGLFNGYSKMAMKQTQTKMFEFSDVGLDFCAGSKNLFPDRFKKMLALGYNTQTVSSVAVTGKQVVLTYGVNHGYVADRVLKLNATNLNGEYVIDSVTSNTVTLTIDNAPSTVSGGFTTFIAPFGMQLVYEQANIHIYKMKALDDSEYFFRIVFQSVLNQRNRIGVSIGKTADLVTGKITDINAHQDYAALNTASAPFALEFGGTASATANDFTYTQGFATYGKWVVIGSPYHFIMSGRIGVSAYGNRFNAILPVFNIGHTLLNSHVAIGEISSQALTSPNTGDGQNERARGAAYIGKYKVALREFGLADYSDQILGMTNNAISSFLPESIDTFNTSTAKNIYVYDIGTAQNLGVVSGGAYVVHCNISNAPPKDSLPALISEIDSNSKIYLCGMAGNGGNNNYFATPIEEIKIV